MTTSATSSNNKENGKTPNEIGIGIDLGTTFSAVAFLKDNVLPTIIAIPYNGRTMPSLVSLGPDGQIWVGKETITASASAASASASGAAAYNYCNVKRVIGTGGKISKDIAQVVPHVVRNPSGKTYKKNSLVNQIYDAQEYPTLLQSSSAILNHAHAQTLPQETTRTTIQPEVIVSYILARLKAVAEEHTGCRVTRAVIGVPAYFHDAQRAATIKAAAMAGMHKVKLLREPEAAALAYGIGKQQQQQQQEQVAQNGGGGSRSSSSNSNNNGLFADDYNKDELVLVFDLGGGTFDVSMLLVGGGVTEIICTSGDVQLGGSDFDRRVANHFQKLLTNHGASSSIARNWSAVAKNAIVRCAEAVRIHLSNNRKALLALPLLEESWTNSSQMDVILPLDLYENQTAASLISESGTSNSTHVIVEFTRQRMEQLCKEEFQALLRPVREVAIMSGALLPGDSRPSVVEAALEMEQELQQQQEDEELLFDDFYNDEEEGVDDEVSIEDERILLQLQEADVKQAKKAQQRGRRRSRTLAKEERKYREERRKLENKKDTTRGQSSSSSSSGKDVGNVKVRDGISGRPISRVVLVGGATRMPAIGRLIATLTGVVPQKTVNPDEAVALGCAVHVGVLDGVEGMGTVLNPMQAAILHAVAQQQQQQLQGLLDIYDNDEDVIDDDEFSEVVEYS